MPLQREKRHASLVFKDWLSEETEATSKADVEDNGESYFICLQGGGEEHHFTFTSAQVTALIAVIAILNLPK